MRLAYGICGALALVGILLIFGCAAKPADRAGAVVKVMVGDGHGSAVHIGNGLIITAAHVVNEAKTVKLKSDVGDVQEGTVLWIAKDYDIALIRASRPERLASSELDCRDMAEGDTIIARGNPAAVEFTTVYGHIAGKARTVGPWATAYVTDIATVPGMSGGAVYDLHGKVRGITVGVMQVPAGVMGASIVGLGFAVPSSAVCNLMGMA